VRRGAARQDAGDQAHFHRSAYRSPAFSVIAAGGTALAMYLRMRPGEYNAQALFDVIRRLGTELRRRSRHAVPGRPKRLLERSHAPPSSPPKAAGLVERLPAYAPELDPVEALWAQLKEHHLANCRWDTIEQVVTATEDGIVQIRRSQRLLFSFLERGRLASPERHVA
jgi:transposase